MRIKGLKMRIKGLKMRTKGLKMRINGPKMRTSSPKKRPSMIDDIGNFSYPCSQILQGNIFMHLGGFVIE